MSLVFGFTNQVGLSSWIMNMKLRWKGELQLLQKLTFPVLGLRNYVDLSL
jgi:hypothetical protein